jgi:hypothetical protein
MVSGHCYAYFNIWLTDLKHAIRHTSDPVLTQFPPQLPRQAREDTLYGRRILFPCISNLKKAIATFSKVVMSAQPGIDFPSRARARPGGASIT